ncbi:MAG: sialidase family protein [Thermoleophilaceae bacterium]
MSPAFGPYLKARGNRRVTAASETGARSESAVAVNPQNVNNVVGASKKFIDPAKYHFTLAPVWTKDGGITWHEAELPHDPEWDGMTDPTVAFDGNGHVFLVAEGLKFREPVNVDGLGMSVFRSSDGGETWEQPKPLTHEPTDDKQWVLCDNNPNSPHHGNVYVAWGAGQPLRFCRSLNGGDDWQGKGSEPSGSTIVERAFAPDLSISADGTLHIFWHMDASNSIEHVRSTDGGETFEPQRSIVTDVKSLRGNLAQTGPWPHFDHGQFRVITVVTSCASLHPDPAAPTGPFVSALYVAWADMREGRSRIYWTFSPDDGVSWDPPKPLLPQVPWGDKHCFHPQIVATGTGDVGCAFYTFGEEEQGSWRIHLRIAPCFFVEGFSAPLIVTSRAWDPLVDAPKANGLPDVDFIGEYFGLDAGASHFRLLWTDTRNGRQELYSDYVQVETASFLSELADQTLSGVIEDGGGLVFVGGRLHRIPPSGPARDAIEAIAGLGFEDADATAVEAAVANAVKARSG